MAAAVAALGSVAATSLSAPEARAGDPWLRWHTITTPHFRVTYHSGLEEPAQRVATLAEGIHRRVASSLGHAPGERTEVLLTDDTDSANGSATVVPYAEVRMYATAPDDMSPLGDYDDWLLELLTHEYAHVVHLDQISGLPALVNQLFGRIYAPNQVQPRWIIEGLAVALESEHTGAGRLRSTQFDMYLRADVLAGRLATLDQISNPARRWPSGNLWYLYGGKFVGWIAEVYGPETFGAVAADYGASLIPWGINRAIRRVTGRTYPQLYRGFRAHLERRYGDQARAIRARGLREGTRLTHRGRVAGPPRFVPRCGRAGAREELLYTVDDGQTPVGIYRLPLEAPDRAAEADAELVTRTNGRTLAFDGECGTVFEGIAPSTRRYFFGDLFRLPAGKAAPRGSERVRERLTVGRRAREPDVSRDGRRVVYVTNRAGSSVLRLADYGPDHRLRRERTLVEGLAYEQVYTPRFSPDGRHVAYGTWTRGGYRDIRVVTVATGEVRRITGDRAIDQQPTWSPDGAHLYFVSDRTGVANVYRHELATGALRQVTNVLTGAYMPELSEDGGTLVYVGYGPDGFDLWSMPVDPARLLPAPPEVTERPGLPPATDARWPVEPYSPWRTLRPRAYEVDLVTGSLGDALLVTTIGADLVGHHGVSAALSVDLDQAEWSGSVGYAYRRLPFDLGLRAFRSISMRRGYRYGDQEPTFLETYTGASSSIGYSAPGELDGQSYALTYTIGEFDSRLPVGPVADPYALVTRDPHTGVLGTVSLSWTYANADGPVYGIGAERGFYLAAVADWADTALGSTDSLLAVNTRAGAYVPLPWGGHHVLALGAAGGMATGTYPRRGFFATGGFDDTLPLVDAWTDGVQQSAFVLRGYEPAQFVGSSYGLAKGEWRFPLAYVDRGVSTLPAFLRTVSGAFFVDWGGAFDRIDLEEPLESFHTGVGAELWLDLVFGYYAPGNLRLGAARGLDSDAAAGWQTYLVVAGAL
ncbi:MAG: PD40 domain-containing protein [Polyangiaceae bacterium]|nr:PD40 domain-containing protein [Polyangiaceae bacterium]